MKCYDLWNFLSSGDFFGFKIPFISGVLSTKSFRKTRRWM